MRAGLAQACGLHTFPQRDDDALAPLAFYHSRTNHLGPSLADFAVPVLSRHSQVAAGDNPERLSSEGSFAALCGASPVDASSGRQHRHRLNRGGNRDANRALWVIAIVRMASDPSTRSYVSRRTHEGLSKKEILRCLKRYIARQLYRLLLTSITAPLLPTTPLDRQ